MKKNLLFIFTALILSFTFTSCKTLKVSSDDDVKFVLVSVYSNPNLPWKVATADLRKDNNEDKKGNGGLINNAITSLTGKADPEVLQAQDRCDYVVTSLEKYFKQSGLNLLDHSLLKETEVYKNTKASLLSKFETSLIATDYKIFNEMDGKDAKRIAEETGADYLIYVKAYYQKEKIRTSALDLSAQADATITFTLLDKKGKRVFVKKYNEDSSACIEAPRSKYDHQAMVDLFPNAIDHCVEAFLSDIAYSENIGISEEALEDIELYGDQGTSISLPSKNNSEE